MDDETITIKRLRKTAHRYACRRGYPSHADDYASYACMRYVEKTFSKHQWVFVDFLRKYFADYKSRYGVAKANGHYHYTPLEALEISAIQETNWIQIATELKIKNRERASFLLHYQFGFSLRDIAILFGTHQSIMTHLMKKIHQQMTDFDPSVLDRQKQIITGRVTDEE
jgi:DNA-directed RNA polymerase specialized sigma24 family protein